MSKIFKKGLSVFAFALMAVQLQIKAQQDNPINKIAIASPTAASLGKYGDIPVNNHTGLPQISIPIYTASSGPLSLPVSLSYHASGLKVQEPASWVGAGWSLNSGGVITRSVMGAPDEKGTNNAGIERAGHFSDYGYSNYIWNPTIGNGTPVNNPINTGAEDWAEVAKGYLDGEPDLFFFNFGGYSGKFYFRDDRTPVVVPEADFKIEPYYNPDAQTQIKSIQSFIITTPDGTKYYFGYTPGLTGTLPIEITNPSTAGNGVSTANVISSWYLNRITTGDEQFSISLTYATEDYSFHTLSMFPIEEVPLVGSNTFGPYHGYELIKNIVRGVRLSQIIFPNGTVNFSIDGMQARSDLSSTSSYYIDDAVNQNAKPLGAIVITDGTNPVKKFNFSYSYFVDNTTTLAQDIANFAPNLSTDKKRLRLDHVQEVSGDNSLSKPPHNFTYFSEQLPRRLSFAIDHWGYNNGITTNTGLIPSYTNFQTNQTIYSPGADRDSYWPAMRAGTLQQINYPTGGYSLFEFEPNTVYNTASSNVNTTLAYLNAFGNLYGGQYVYAVTQSFVSNGTGINISLVNNANYSASITITNSNNVVVFNNTIGTGQNFPTNPLYLTQGTYTTTLSFPAYGNLSGACTVVLTQWQTVTTVNTVVVGGNRIKTLTHNDGVTSNNIVTSYNYNGDDGRSSCVLFSRPAYVGIRRNDFVRDIGFFNTASGFQQTPSLYGCLCIINACIFKSPCAIRPMATTQGNPLGYSQVKVSQTGNGYSVYKYYGPTGVPPWQVNTGDVAVRSVNSAACDNNAPSFPYPPLPYDFLRGELKYEAHYNEANQMLKEKSYVPVYVNNPIKTPALKAELEVAGCVATKYELTTARKTQTQLTETDYDPATNTSLTTTSTSYYESPFHTEVTRTSAVNSKSEMLETKKKYAFDFRISTCESISDGYAQYNTDCATCLANKNAAIAACPYNNITCTTIGYLTYMRCLNTARSNWVAYRRTNFINPVNTFKTNHDNAKAGAGTELKPILQLQDNYENPVIETSKWKNGNLLGASFSRYDYSTVPAGKVYINKVQAINLAASTAAFTNAATNGTNNSIIKDSRYKDESFVKFYNGNLAEIISKDGVNTSYLWGYNNALPIAKAIGTDHTALLNAHTAVGGNLSLLRSQFAANTIQLNTYTYTPLTGITTETDVNGKSITYEYDKLQRLLLARDFNNNIVKQYDYQYQAAVPNANPQWVATGNTRCEPCPGNPLYWSGNYQNEEQDNNPYSPTYNTLRYMNNYTMLCEVSPDFQNTGLPYCIGNNQFQDQIDVNPCSSSFNTTRQFPTGNPYACAPPPTCDDNCTGANKKCVYNNCETGTIVYTASVYNSGIGTWICTYHYLWSDNSISQDYSTTSGTPCL